MSWFDEVEELRARVNDEGGDAIDNDEEIDALWRLVGQAEDALRQVLANVGADS